MTYTCQNCGATADDYNRLCKPSSVEVESKFCGAPAGQVCDEKIKVMKYSCAACGSMSADAEHLCDPGLIRH